MDTPLSPAHKILLDHKIDGFRASILGTSLGTLIDQELTDLEILTVVEGFCSMIRAASKDPRMLESLEEQQKFLADAARADET